MKFHTIEAEYEYRITNIVNKLFHDLPVRIQLSINDGETLESMLDDNKEKLAEALLDDIQEWMGFDELLKQVKGE